MNEQSAFIINEESHEKIVKENEEEKRKEVKRKKTNARQRAYYQRQKDLKKNEEIIKTVPKSNAERQRKFRQHNAEKSYMDIKRRKLCSNEKNIVRCSAVENIENVTLQENQFHSQQLHIYEQRNECITPEVILHRNTGIPGDVLPSSCRLSTIKMINTEIESDNQHKKSSASSSAQTNEADVILVESEEDGENSNEDKEKAAKKKRRFSWVFVKKFENAADARNAVDDSWSIHYTNETNHSKTTYYKCNKVNKREAECPAKIHLFFEATSDAVFLFKNEVEHDHKNTVVVEKGLYRIPDKVKLEINKLSDLHLKPRAILSALTKIHGIKAPSINKIINYVTKRRRRRAVNLQQRALNLQIDNYTINIAELEEWLQNNSVVPEYPHEAFVIGYEICPEDSAFRFVLSTKYLLEFSLDVDILHADATYKLIWHGCPVFIVGTTDKNHIFHALCLAVSTTDHKAVFQMIFKSMKDKIQSLFSVSFNPTMLVADAATSIQSAFKDEFQNTTVRMCWTHAKRRLNFHIDNTVKDAIKTELANDLEGLHLLTSKSGFETALNLFSQKYNEEPQFLSNLKQEWLLKNPNWYLGAARPSPSTNNAFHYFVRTIKGSDTVRKRLVFPRFLALVEGLVYEWSTKYVQSPEKNFFAKTPGISLQDWITANIWANGPHQYTIIYSDEHFTKYEVHTAQTSKTSVIIDNAVTQFNEFVEKFFSKLVVKLPFRKSNWAQGTCTCSRFWEMYICEHVIGLAIRLGHTLVPAAAIAKSRRKRGRPFKTKIAVN